MGDPHAQTFRTGERLAGKWQIPACVLSVVLLVIVALRVKSPERKIGIDTYLQSITTLLDSGLYDSAAQLTERLLGWDDLDVATRGMLYQYSGRAGFGRAVRLVDTSAATAAEVVGTFERALEHGALLSAEDFRQMAECCERLGQYRTALKHHMRAVGAAVPPGLRYRRRVIELSEYPLRLPAEEIDRLLEDFIADAQDSAEDLIWALARRMQSLSATEGWQEAGELLDKYSARFAETSLQSEYRYLIALSLYGAGRYDEAERRLRSLLNDATVSDPLYPKAGWLLGRVVMNDGRAQRPEEAVSIFREVVSSRANRVYMIASRVGLAEALAELCRFEDSLESYDLAIDELERVSGDRLINPDAIRSSLSVTASRCRRDGDLRTALGFLRLAVTLIAPDDTATQTKYLLRLGRLQAALARELAVGVGADGGRAQSAAQTNGWPSEVRQLLDEAGENHVRVAWLNTLNEQRSSDAMWTAAGLFDEGGNHERAIETLQAFVRDRSDAEIIPRVLLRLGRSLQAARRYTEAIEAYQRDISSYPRSAHANAALIPLAECFMALGAEYEQEAEGALKEITEDSAIFTPAAPEYRDAMFLMGDLYCRQGKYEQAIPVLDEALQNYADDARVVRAAFLAANAYRQSALALKEDLLDPELVGQSKRLQVEMTQRFEEAARRFRALTTRLEQRGESSLSELEQLYLQDSRLYEGACLFELQRYQDALALYERAAWIYKDSPAALGAYVQVINCYVFLGREEDAVSSLRRAQYLVEIIADEQYDKAGRFENREGWKRYFDWVAETLVRS